MLPMLNLSVGNNLKSLPVEIFSNILQKIFIMQLWDIFIIYRNMKFHTTRFNQQILNIMTVLFYIHELCIK